MCERGRADLNVCESEDGSDAGSLVSVEVRTVGEALTQLTQLLGAEDRPLSPRSPPRRRRRQRCHALHALRRRGRCPASRLPPHQARRRRRLIVLLLLLLLVNIHGRCHQTRADKSVVHGRLHSPTPALPHSNELDQTLVVLTSDSSKHNVVLDSAH